MDTRRVIGRATAYSLLALGAAVAFSAPASATVTFNSLETYADSSASVIATGSGFALPVLYTGPDDEYTTSIPVGTFTSLSYSQADAVVTPKHKLPTVQAAASDIETTQASFVDPTSATVEFSGSSTAKVITPGAGAFAQSNLGYFVYGFSIDTKSSITIDYDVAADGAYTGFFPGYTSYVYDASNDVYLQGTAALNTNGSLSAILNPGSYYLEIDNSIGNDFSSSTAGLSSASSVADFGFGISAVPEPGVWIMMLGGFGMLGGMLRMGHALRRERAVKGAATA